MPVRCCGSLDSKLIAVINLRSGRLFDPSVHCLTHKFRFLPPCKPPATITQVTADRDTPELRERAMLWMQFGEAVWKAAAITELVTPEG